MKKSKCVLTMPRSGSEVMMSHISRAYDLENIFECLSYNIRSPQTLEVKNDSGNFYDRYHFSKPDVTNLLLKDVVKFTQFEFEERLRLIKSYDKSVAVKTFLSSTFYLRYTNLERLFKEFDVIVLVRRDAFKCILSACICKTIDCWHIQSDEQFTETKQKLSETHFRIDEDYFLGELKHINELKIIAESSTTTSVYYEDFEESPTILLNKILGTDVDETYIPSQRKFIDDHEKNILNIEDLKRLYKRYSKYP